MTNTLTKEYLVELFDYKDGKLFWKVNRCRAKLGSEAGRTKTNKYCEVRVDGKLHGTHRLIFLMHNGFLPKVIDHIDGNPSNNRLENLRPATHEENMWNARLSTTNTSGFKGVSWNKNSGQWQAQCNVKNKNHYLGLFDDIFEAAAAVKKFRNENHKFFANHGE
jgi:hypothetical protein